jgi:ribosomal protein L40E
MTDSADACPSCGARVPAGAEHCDLCGAPVAGEEAAPQPAPDEAPEPVEEAPPDPSGLGDEEAPEHVFCTQCGFRNPGTANYCSRCGTELRDLSGPPSSGGTRPVTADLPRGTEASPDADASEADETPSEADETPSEADEPAAVGAQIAWMVGVGVLVVLGFFFATQWSQQYEWGADDASAAGGEGGPAAAQAGPQAGPASGSPSGPAAAQGGASAPDTDLRTLVEELGGPVEGAVADRIDSLRAAAENAQGDRRRQVRAELVRMYIGAGTPGRAALLQRQLAEETGTVDARRRAADLLYRWMRQVEQQGDRARVADVAGHVAAAYQAVADQRPEDLDARTRMGEAYLLTNNPMKGIRAINDVLAEDSTFVPARFQKGLALLQINRLDQAIEQFRRVREYADPQQPFYKQAERAIEIIEKRRASAAGDTSAATP